MSVTRNGLRPRGRGKKTSWGINPSSLAFSHTRRFFNEGKEMSTAKTNSILKAAPECPKSLTGLAALHWREYVPLLCKDKVVCKVDIPVLIMACQCYELSQTADKPAERYKAQSQYISIMSKFGATYKARVQLEMDNKAKPEVKSEADDNFMEYR